MTTSIRLGVECNLNCQYCLLGPVRKKKYTTYNLKKIKKTVKKIDNGFNLAGGEPLVYPKDELEELFEFGYENWGWSVVQTNGVLVDEDYIEMFKQYNVTVFVSVDGPGELNKFRTHAAEKPKQATARTINNVKRLCGEGVPVQVGILLSQANASAPEQVNRLKEFILNLNYYGVERIHVKNLYLWPLVYTLSTEEIEKCKLSSTRQKQVFLELAEFSEKHPEIGWQFFSTCKSMLMATNNSCCVFKACDYANTNFTKIVGPQGQLKNCFNSYPLGMDPIQNNHHTYHRYVSLYLTPVEQGGCKGCRFYSVCLGFCPATALDDDPRNRSQHCETFKALFEFYEQVLLEAGEKPISRREDRETIEKKMVEEFRSGRRASVSDFL